MEKQRNRRKCIYKSLLKISDGDHVQKVSLGRSSLFPAKRTVIFIEDVSVPERNHSLTLAPRQSAL